MKVKEKAETVAINGCMLTLGMRECKSDVYMKFLSEFKQSDSGASLQYGALAPLWYELRVHYQSGSKPTTLQETPYSTGFEDKALVAGAARDLFAVEILE